MLTNVAKVLPSNIKIVATFPHPIKGRVTLNIRIPLQGEQVLILLTIALYLMANHQASV